MRRSPPVHPLAFAALLASNVALAFGPWFVRLADVGPVASAFWRIALAAPVLAALALASGWRPRGIGRGTGPMTGLGLGIAVFFAGICFAADLGSWHLGILRTTLANATLFGNSATIIYPVYGFLIARAWPSQMQAVALLLAGAGGALLMGRSYQLDSRHLAGDLLCLAAGILYTGYFVLMARAREILPPLPALALSTLASLLPLLVFAVVLGEQLWPDRWWPLVALALASQVVGQGLMIFALGQLPPVVVGIALLIQPVVAATIGWIAYAERPGVADLAGALLVAAALVLVRQARRDALAPDTPADA
ncbi:DMT family transporter [uncultured Sphingomonas sp.]|uniref:DMT family transporter n=1 Tax=uncultured Sphingomonas sp. TaxID=158754 RepID=UPI0035CB02DD